MTRGLYLALVVTVAGARGSPEQSQSAKELERQAKEHVGKVAVLCGTVASLGCERDTRNTLLYLNDQPGKVRVAISPEQRHSFGAPVERQYLLRNICVTGIVEKRKGNYEIALSDVHALKIQDADGNRTDTFGADAYFGCDEGVDSPRLLRDLKPQYTGAAKSAGIQGTVVLQAVVRDDGQIGEVRVLQPLDQKFGLDEAAMRALRAWRFVPGMKSGRPVPVIILVELSFRLR